MRNQCRSSFYNTRSMGSKSTLSRDQVKELGFTDMPHFTIMGSLTLEIGRRRELSIGNLGTPNEMMFLSERDEIRGRKIITDTVVVHNYDYDGYLTIEKLKTFITLVMCPRFKK